MAIRKSAEEVFDLSESREILLDKCESALKATGFSKIQKNITLFQIEASYKSMTVVGDISIILTTVGNNTKVTARSTANMDNIFALFKSPTKVILSKFKEGISTL